VNHARIQPVRRESLRQTIHAALAQRILTGALAPGSRINESTLSRSLGVSPTPVREALLVLEGQGFLVARPAKGFFVRNFSEEEIRDLYPVLAELEVMALKAAGLPPAEVTDRLERANKRFAAFTGRPDAAIQQDNRFHTLLLAPCRNAYLLHLVERSRRASYRYEYAYLGERDHVARSHAQHREIVVALRGGRLDEALDCLRRNWLDSAGELIAWLRDKEERKVRSRR